MDIRRLTLDDDSDALARLHAGCFTAAWDAPDFETYLSRETDDVLALYVKNKLAGLSVLRTVVDQSDILTICMAKKYRGKGRAAALLKASEDAVARRGADIIFLDVAEDNPAAIALYRRAGYIQHGRRSGYYRRPDARIGALLFQKRLI